MNKNIILTYITVGLLMITSLHVVSAQNQTENILVNPQIILNTFKVGQEVPIQITISNNENKEVPVRILVNLPDNVLVTGSYMVDSTGSTVISSINLPPNTSRTVTFTITVTKPGKYVLPVILKTNGSEKVTNIVFTVIDDNQKQRNNITRIEGKNIYVIVNNGVVNINTNSNTTKVNIKSPKGSVHINVRTNVQVNDKINILRKVPNTKKDPDEVISDETLTNIISDILILSFTGIILVSLYKAS